MDERALQKAKSRLRVAGKALAEITTYLSKEHFDDNWYSFLTASKSIYTTLEQGAKSNVKSRQWFGLKSKERREDDLLQYIYQARNDDEHGIESTAKHIDGKVTVRARVPAHPEYVIRVGTMITSDGGLKFQDKDLNEQMEIIKHVLPSVQLMSVRARGNVIYHPPTAHLGLQISAADQTPLGIATLGFGYLVKLVAEAEGLRTPSP